MKHTPSLPVWSVVLPLAAAVYYLLGFTSLWAGSIGSLLLMGSIISAVHHAEVVAHKVGEPFGTVILALSITVLEVGLIVSMMVAGGKESAVLARDTVFAAVMLIMNGILGTCLLIGSVKYHEQFFDRKSATLVLVALVAMLVFALILPNFTVSSGGGTYTAPQLLLIAVSMLIIYATFMLVQTVRHRDYFLADDDDADHHADPPSAKVALASFVLLLVCLGVVVMMAKGLSPLLESAVRAMGAPHALVGVIIAVVVLLPEGLAATRAALHNRFQTSLNLALGSALASIGLTIPAVAFVCLMMDLPLMLGLPWKSMVLLALTVFTVMLSLNHGKTNVLYGVVLLVNAMVYVFTVVVP